MIAGLGVLVAICATGFVIFLMVCTAIIIVKELGK